MITGEASLISLPFSFKFQTKLYNFCKTIEKQIYFSYIDFENFCWNEIPDFAGVLAFGKRQNKKSEKLKPDQYILNKSVL